MNNTIVAGQQHFISYSAFMRTVFSEKVSRYKRAGITPPTFDEFKSYSMASNGLSPWLESLRGLQATEKQIYSILNTYMKEAKRSLSDIPNILCWLDRYYDIETPVVEGIATEAYWRKRLQPSNN
ncbi:MAG: hypothetical protein CBB95_17875 [Alteromonas sp. TMED35]|uniref:hypothetical protein n=1 Tax=uncultured Alteromonas sp. TaxID=179113 RepID=UPI000B6DA2CE|nr:MAG: hypothetical protein CBB95_17875 [Alteromonas sp. TMED35]|tara:strand:+ start:62337 stop:62711 length:375 start_codon:yes stop_codon:yes gene_type:complete